jgi:hypothetical protein
MGLFSKSPTVPQKPVPQSFDLEVLHRRAKEVRQHYGQASGRLFDMCYFIQRTGELPNPEELTHALATFMEARTMIEFLEEMQVDVQGIQVTSSGNSTTIAPGFFLARGRITRMIVSHGPFEGQIQKDKTTGGLWHWIVLRSNDKRVIALGQESSEKAATDALNQCIEELIKAYPFKVA